MADALGSLFGFGGGVEDQYRRLDRATNQTAKEAEPRYIIWGRVRPISGNIIHMSDPTYKMVKVGEADVGKEEQDIYQEHVYRTYAIRICEGPISGIVRIWKDDILVYDARGNDWGNENNEKFMKNCEFHLGEWDQLPDASLESVWGVGEVPAYRGTCYIVLNEDDLTDYGGRIPTFIFEVQRNPPFTYLTSLPYDDPIEDTTFEYVWTENSSRMYSLDPFEDYVEMGESGVELGEFREGRTLYVGDPEEAVQVTGSVISGELREALKRYTSEDFAQANTQGVINGELREALKRYTNEDFAQANTQGVISGDFDFKLITYEQEAEQATGTYQGVTGGIFEQ